MPAFFRSTLGEFATIGATAGLHKLTSGLAAEGFNLTPEQHVAWTEEWPLLEAAFSQLIAARPQASSWHVLLEFPIPGRRKRIDVVVLTDRGIIVVESKGAASVTNAAVWQVREYCWNLRDFHRSSRGVEIAPIVCAVASSIELHDQPRNFSDRHRLVLDVEVCGPTTLSDALHKAYSSFRHKWECDAAEWDKAPIEPTLSVIEYAQKLFGGHDVREIFHAHADNTDAAVDELRNAVVEARRDSKRIICFVTGVPGAGKTLVGLNAAYRKEMISAAGGPVCFASGNQPLLDVIKAALVMNRTRGTRERHEVEHDVGAPVQNVHEFARETLCRDDEQPPAFHVVVFDEAQRVWDAEKLADGLEKRRRRSQLSTQQIQRITANGASEPELLLSVMERWKNWCVVIALIGGGQEIHNGEAGLAEWGRALGSRSDRWSVWVSGEALRGGVSSARQRLFSEPPPKDLLVTERDQLHLAVSKRSRRAERYADWVNSVVSGDSDTAKAIAAELAEFPVFVTRDLRHAREILREHCPPELRSGLLASSGAVRLRAEGIEVSADFRNGISFPDWFLRPTGDIRSSSQLEVAATEFECQGLELDWCCVCWGGDFTMLPGQRGWRFRKLRAPAGRTPQWYAENDVDICEFVRNKYRVLLTRARTGVIIFVPFGDAADSTRERPLLDATTEYLVSCGAVIPKFAGI
jgi:hypothetical protein